MINMAFCDFVVKYDPEKDSMLDLTKKILYSIVIKRLIHKKPAVIYIGGESGEGKSFTALRLEQLLLEIQGIDLKDYINDVNVYTPLQYPEKLDALLSSDRLKKVNILCMHEAREIVKAKMWHSFLTQAIADVNAMSRAVKRLCIIIISQFIRDITSDIRYTLNYYCVVRRPKGKKARLYINVLWKDDRDLEKPKLRKRKLSGYLVYPNGRYRRYVPQYLELTKPDKDLTDVFVKSDYDAKVGIIKHKLNKLMKEMNAEFGDGNKKILAMVEYYVKNPDNLSTIGRQWRGSWKVKPEARRMHDLTVHESKQFETMLNEKLKQGGVISDGTE